MNRSTLIVGAVAAALVLFSGGYWVGANTGPKPSASPPSATGAAGAATGQRGPGGPGGAGGFNAPLGGRVISVNADSITIALNAPRGSGASPQPGAPVVQTSAIALVGTSTRIIRTSEAEIKLNDLKAGDQVTVIGSTDQTTGTVSAQAIVVGAANVLGELFGGPGGGAFGPGGQGGAPRPGASPTR